MRRSAMLDAAPLPPHFGAALEPGRASLRLPAERELRCRRRVASSARALWKAISSRVALAEEAGARTRRCAAALAVLLWGLAPATRADEVDRFLARQRAVHAVPGLVVGVMRQGRLVAQHASGLAQVELGVRVRADHVFELGSISKQFTAYAVLIFVERGQLGLDEPLGRHLPELPDEWARRTLRQLMAHQSGLPDLEEAFGYPVYRETPTDEQFLQRLLALPIVAAPGTEFRYSNTNYWLLARVLERVSGQPFAQLMQTEVFGPLGMTSTRSALPRQLLPRRASGYQLVGETLENRDPMGPQTARGLGDLASTLRDMARWEQEQRSPRLLKRETAALAHQPQRLADGTPTDYGFGWFIGRFEGRPVLRHDGQSAGFTAAYVRVPQDGLAVVVFGNSWDAPTPTMATRVLRLVEPSLAGPRLLPARQADAARLQRVREYTQNAVQAGTAWREDWFSPELWQQLRPYLPTIEQAARRRGPVRSVVPVGPRHRQDEARPAYRVTYQRVTRTLRIEFDPEGRIKSTGFEEE